jgi:hypothetical protein
MDKGGKPTKRPRPSRGKMGERDVSVTVERKSGELEVVVRK